MATDLIRYDLLVQEALRGVVRNVLTETAKNGLQGEHHFFITFKTNAPGLRLSNRMRERYPDEMTIILQHQFWDLGVTEHAFEVGLSFSNVPERLLVPFSAITSFVDPSVQFGLKFDVQEQTGEEGDEVPEDGNVAKLPQAADASKLAGGALPKPLAAVPVGEDKPDQQDEPAKPSHPEGEPAKVVSIDAFRKKT